MFWHTWKQYGITDARRKAMSENNTFQCALQKIWWKLQLFYCYSIMFSLLSIAQVSLVSLEYWAQLVETTGPKQMSSHLFCVHHHYLQLIFAFFFLHCMKVMTGISWQETTTEATSKGDSSSCPTTIFSSLRSNTQCLSLCPWNIFIYLLPKRASANGIS